MIEIDRDELQKHWRDPYMQWYAAGMPAFTTSREDPWKQLRIKFKTKEDREHFAATIGVKLTDRTNVIWHPEKPRDQNMLNRYEEL